MSSSTCQLNLVFQVLPNSQKRRFSKVKAKSPCKTCIVLGSGGHTMEMFQLLEGLDRKKYWPRLYILAVTDHLSEKNVHGFERRESSVEDVDYMIRKIPRAREVGQPWSSTPFTVLKSLLACSTLILTELPDLIICNGPGSCIPVCVISYIPRILGIKWAHLVYIESFARVHNLSLSGLLLIRFVDRFLVQWPSLQKKYPLAQYSGVLV
ncbi:hypothetical protein G9A89_022505 [Geosiphon pyriformis]|nr:hypothetical protein G9A89_022505 [Geosiphon pyriformis]